MNQFFLLFVGEEAYAFVSLPGDFFFLLFYFFNLPSSIFDIKYHIAPDTAAAKIRKYTNFADDGTSDDEIPKNFISKPYSSLISF